MTDPDTAQPSGFGDGRSRWSFAAEVMRPALIVGDHELLGRVRRALVANGVAGAVARHDTPALFDWLLALFQLQGISDAGATGFTATRGPVHWTDLAADLGSAPACARLRSHWHFERCGYRKEAATCLAPSLMAACPLPRRPLRNGRLSQGAYALFLFLRDVCDGDLVSWIDERLARADACDPSDPARARVMRAALLGPMREIFGVSDKVLSMTLADLLLGGDPDRERWVTTGASMIAIDTLVHNFLHRTGILRRFRADHPYGPGCYGPKGCAAIIEGLASRIDARAFNPTFPAVFPRFVQQSIWRFCAMDERNICNGNLIDDRGPCQQRFCPAGEVCERVVLHEAVAG